MNVDMVFLRVFASSREKGITQSSVLSVSLWQSSLPPRSPQNLRATTRIYGLVVQRGNYPGRCRSKKAQITAGPFGAMWRWSSWPFTAVDWVTGPIIADGAACRPSPSGTQRRGDGPPGQRAGQSWNLRSRRVDEVGEQRTQRTNQHDNDHQAPKEET